MPLKITFTYNNNTDTTKMTINDDNLFPITKLDFLKDITLLIDELYAKSKIQFINNPIIKNITFMAQVMDLNNINSRWFQTATINQPFSITN